MGRSVHSLLLRERISKKIQYILFFYIITGQDEDFSDDNVGDEDQRAVLIENKAFTGCGSRRREWKLIFDYWERSVFSLLVFVLVYALEVLVSGFLWYESIHASSASKRSSR